MPQEVCERDCSCRSWRQWFCWEFISLIGECFLASAFASRSIALSLVAFDLIENCSGASAQGFVGKRFFQETRPGFEGSLLRDYILRVAGYEQHFKGGPQGYQALGQRSSVHSRQYYVADEKMDCAGMLLRDF